MSQRNPAGEHALPVLLFGAQGVEFLSAGTSQAVYLRSDGPVEVGAGAALIAAELLVSHGQAPGPCVLALGGAWTSQRVINLPQVARRDLEVVLQRKAAALLETEPDEALFAALPLDIEEGAKEHKWMVLATRRRAYLALRYALRERGFRVRKAVSERMALASVVERTFGTGSAQGRTPASGTGATADTTPHIASETTADTTASDAVEATIVVGMESGAIAVHLLHGGDLVHQSVLTAHFDDDAAMAKALVQELRGFDAFWRRRSRGGTVGRVVLVGFGPRWADRLVFAARAAIPQAICERLLHEGQSESQAARPTALAACRTETKLQLSLDLPLSPSRGSLAAIGVASVVVAACLALVAVEDLDAREARFDSERAALEVRSVDHDELLKREQEITCGLDLLGRHRRRIEYLGSRGLPFEDLLRDTLDVIGGRGALTSVAVSLGGLEPGRVTMTGRMPSEPIATQSAIEGMLEAAEHTVTLKSFEVATPRAGSDRATTLEFTAEARLEVHP